MFPCSSVYKKTSFQFLLIDLDRIQMLTLFFSLLYKQSKKQYLISSKLSTVSSVWNNHHWTLVSTQSAKTQVWLSEMLKSRAASHALA